tara:strand:- start:1649 stop:1873 length:225 start_codon:yes stop_codon:yes gene_type:complete
VHRSELAELIDGEIADGGGDLTVVVEVKLESTVEDVLLFVSIQLELVVLSQPSALAIKGAIVIITKTIATPHST